MKSRNSDKISRTALSLVLAVWAALLQLAAVSVCAAAPVGTLLYVPMDNRPVCLAYTEQSMRDAGWDVQLPPAEFIAGATKAGNPEGLFSWLEEQAPQASAMVVSADAMLYGGLVASRTHQLPFDVLQQRAERLVNLKRHFGSAKTIYVFTTIMRSPKASAAPVEPAYYKEWGPRLFRLGELEDRLEAKDIKRREVRELADLRRSIPAEILDDLYLRRGNNIRATELLLHGVESGDFDYLLIGRDDTAPYSQAHREARRMEILVNELPRERIRFFAGADQLGLLLLTRASNRLQLKLPLVNVTYAPGVGGRTIPSYEDDTVAASARQHIYAAGAFPVLGRKRADYVLAVNTPKDGVTLSSYDAANNGVATPETTAFADKLERLLRHGHQVILADVKYGNGADNALVRTLFAKNIAYELNAYSGWNTAGNSVGFALGQGMLRPLTDNSRRRTLLQQRYLDDWAYQSNVRPEVAKTLIWPNHWPNSGLDEAQKQAAEAAVTAGIRELARPLLGGDVDKYRFTLPWSRMFEVYAEAENER